MFELRWLQSARVWLLPQQPSTSILGDGALTQLVTPAADRALETLNYTAINAKPIRIMWYFRKSGVGNIFIKVRCSAALPSRKAVGRCICCRIATFSLCRYMFAGWVYLPAKLWKSLAVAQQAAASICCYQLRAYLFILTSCPAKKPV